MNTPPATPSTPAFSSGLPGDEIAAFLQTAALPVISLDADGRMVFFTRRIPEILQWKSGSLAQADLIALARPRDAEVLRIHLARVLQEKQPARCEVELMVPGGAPQWLRLISHPGSDAEGRPVTWSWIENLNTARQSEKTEMFQRRLIEAASSAPSLEHFTTRFFELLKVIFDIQSGYLALMNRRTGGFLFPGHAEGCVPPRDAAPESLGMLHYLVTIGRPIWWTDLRAAGETGGPAFQVPGAELSDVIAIPVRDDKGIAGALVIQQEAPGMTFSSRDVDMLLGAARVMELFMAGTRKGESAMALQAGIEQVSEVIVLTNNAGIVEYVNAAFEKITGYDRAEVIGKSTSVLKSGRQDRTFYQQLWKTLNEGNIWRGHFVNRAKSGEYFEEEATICPVRNAQGVTTHYIAIKRPTDGADEASRRDAGLSSERLLTAFTHDFRNILVAIRSNTELLAMRAGASGVGDEVQQILQAAERAESRIEQWSLLSAGGPARDALNINAGIENFSPVAAKILGEHHALALDLSPRVPAVRIPVGEVEQRLTQLLLWGHLHLAEGSDLLIRTFPSAVPSGDLSEFLELPDETAREFAVLECSGPGLVPTDCGSAGAAASIRELREIATRMRRWRGGVSLHRPGAPDSAIRLYFPAPATASAPVPVRSEPSPAVMEQGHETVLIAEDDPGARRVMARMLQDAGYTVLEAESGAMALRTVLFHNGPIHLLLTDIMMPDFDGRALAGQVKEQNPDIKVLYTSGYERPELEERRIFSPGEQVTMVKKPFRRDDLLAQVRSALAGE